MPILKKSGRIVIAESLAAREFYVAWGIGDGAWTTPPAENPLATGLLDEVGRHIATTVGFVVFDAAGPIVLPTGNYSISATPTENLYVAVNFEPANAPAEIIREVGLFVGTVKNTGLPIGQKYFLPSEILSVGRMLHSENTLPIFRSLSVSESFAFVITI